jgi:hypothetical protein
VLLDLLTRMLQAEAKEKKEVCKHRLGCYFTLTMSVG